MSNRASDDEVISADVGAPAEIADVLATLAIERPRSALVLVGGAGGMSDALVERLVETLKGSVVPVIEEVRAAVVDGGTDAGVMRAMGQARRRSAARFPLVGVAARGTVAVTGSVPEGAAVPEPNHTHLLLVPGLHWGEEAPWIADVATVLADGSTSATLLVNGGEITYDDAERSIRHGRPVIVLSGSGRTADAIADAAARRSDHSRAAHIARSGLVRIVHIDDQAGLQRLIRGVLVQEPRNTATSTASTLERTWE